MSEVAPANQIARLEYVIREQMKEIDRLRDEVRQHHALMAAFEERGTLGILQMMAHDKTCPRKSGFVRLAWPCPSSGQSCR